MIKTGYRFERLTGKQSAGYTMAELMVVTAIISILAAMSFGLLSRMRSQTIESSAAAALNVLATGYEMYYFFNKSYPQWGPDERFQSPKELWDHLCEEDFIPASYKNITYDSTTGYIYGFAEDYAVEIAQYNPTDPTASRKNSYFIIFRPYNFQRDALAIGFNPPTGWVAVRPRKGTDPAGYRDFRLFVFKRGGAGE